MRDDAGPREDADMISDGAGSRDAETLDAGSDAGPPIDEPCESPGMVEEIACGRCGVCDRFCSADLVDGLLALEDVAVGVAEYADFPVDPFGSPGDVPFRGITAPTRTRASVVAGLDALSTMGGNEGPESGIEAFGILSGATLHPNAVRMTCPSGRTAGGCWRTGATRVVILFIDATQHNGPMLDGSAGTFSPYSSVSPTPLTWSSVRSSLVSADVELFAVVEATVDLGFALPLPTTDEATPQHSRVVTALGHDAATNLIARTSATTWASIASTLVVRV